MKLLAITLGALLFATAAAAGPVEDEERARTLFKELRCVVCQNQSIDDSDAEIAADLRRVVRERIADGASNDQIRDDLVARYGEFVLLRPRLNLSTMALWFAPALLLLLALVWFVSSRRRRRDDAPPLDQVEERRLADILNRESAEARE